MGPSTRLMNFTRRGEAVWFRYPKRGHARACVLSTKVYIINVIYLDLFWPGFSFSRSNAVFWVLGTVFQWEFVAFVMRNDVFLRNQVLFSVIYILFRGLLQKRYNVCLEEWFQHLGALFEGHYVLQINKKLKIQAQLRFLS